MNVHPSLQRRRKQATAARARGSRTRRNHIENLAIGSKRFSRPWRYLAANSTINSCVFTSTRGLRSVLPPMRMTLEARKDLKLKLIAEALRNGGTIQLRVRGTSMLPTLWPGDVLTIENTSCRASIPGDIVLVKRNFVHRVKEKHICDGRVWLITQGDAVARIDPFVDDSQLLGKVLFIQRNRHVITPRKCLSTPARSLAWMLCYGDRFRSLCLRLYAYWQNLHHQIGEEIVECPTSTS
jgi:signal peptidase I